MRFRKPINHLITWPPLARQGHLLHTRLTPAEIEQRASEVLAREGETGGPVRLFWKYVPTQLSTGERALTLQVGAAMPLLTGESSTEEPRIVDVDVGACPRRTPVGGSATSSSCRMALFMEDHGHFAEELPRGTATAVGADRERPQRRRAGDTPA